MLPTSAPTTVFVLVHALSSLCISNAQNDHWGMVLPTFQHPEKNHRNHHHQQQCCRSNPSSLLQQRHGQLHQGRSLVSSSSSKLQYEVSNNHDNHGSRHNQLHQAQSMDRLRVDLMRTKLSVKTAEDKARRLETELVEVRQNYDFARRELRELRSKKTGNGDAGEGKKATQVPKVTPAMQQQQRQQQQIRPKPSALQGQHPKQQPQTPSKIGMQTTNKIQNPSQPQNAKSVLPNTRSAALNQLSPSTNLPPMAAALFANAEREEREKRFQRTGIIEQVTDVEDYSSFSSSGNVVEGTDEEGSNQSNAAVVSSGGVAVVSTTATVEKEDKLEQGGQSLPSVLHNNATSITANASITGTKNNQSSTIGIIDTMENNATILQHNRTATSNASHNNTSDINNSNTAKDEQFKTLLEKCAMLTRQQEVLERKLRAAQAIAAAASQSQPNHKAVEETARSNRIREEHHEKEREGWTERERRFELELERLTAERDELARRLLLEDRNGASHATRLLLRSIAEEVVGWTRRASSGGSSGGAASVDDDDDDDAPGGKRGRRRRLASLALRFARRAKGGRGEEDVGRQQPPQQPQQQQTANHTAVHSGATEEGRNHTTTTRSSSDNPLLVRKKRYRPRLFHPMEISTSGALSSMREAARRRKTRDRALSSSSTSSDDVPAFLRKEEL